jgi:diguanylate cyclase (GGDEF)-like protein/PAS domain S-box-containing protein
MQDLAAPLPARRVPDWFAQAPVMALAFDSDGTIVFASERWLAAFGYGREETIGRDRANLFAPGSIDRGQDLDGAFTMLDRDGGARFVELASTSAEGFTFVVVNDMSALRRAERRIAEIDPVASRGIEDITASTQRETRSEGFYRQLAEASNDMVMRLNRDLVRTYVSPASREIFGYAPEALIGKKTGDATHPEDAERLWRALAALAEGRIDRHTVINRRRHRDGRWIWVETKYRAFVDPATGEASEIFATVRDISERKAIEEHLADAYRRLEILAGQDGLTGLANRRTFDERLAKEFRLAERRREPLGLMMIDVDQFKAFNDRYGHPAGDDCLKRIAGAIRDGVDGGGLAARLGGEEFAAFAPSADEERMAELGGRICQAIRGLAIPHAGSSWRFVTASVGAAEARRTRFGPGPTALLADADQALYAAKSQGRNRVERFSRLGHANDAALAG